MNWETVIGLEVHAQLLTESKLFSSASTRFGQQPNTCTSLIDAGLPGVLPQVNAKAIYLAVLFGKAVNATINTESVFERKNYFYPDLPKGYQISQYQKPIVQNGVLPILLEDQSLKNITIERAHLEEDAGKSIYDEFTDCTAIDLNRAGIPLLEIVTTPCLTSAFEAVSYLKKLQQLLRFLKVSDGNMQEGSFRCDVNLSVRPKNSEKLGVRTELKNLNSFKFIEKAILYEQQRHIKYLESNKPLYQETRSYNPDKNVTIALRSKEQEQDYRYFPDPDLLPIKLTSDYINDIKIAELPDDIRNTFKDSIALEDVEYLLQSSDAYSYFMDIKNHTDVENKIIVNWLKGPVQAFLNEQNKSYSDQILPEPINIARILENIVSNKISHETGRKVFLRLIHEELTLDKILQDEMQKANVDESEIQNLILNVINAHPQEVQQYKNGKTKVLGFFVGLTLKQLKGKGDAKLINAMIKESLDKS